MLVDGHNHIDFYESPQKIISLIRENKIRTICVSMDYESYLENLSYGEDDLLIKAFGIHPHRVKGPIDVFQYEEIIKDSPLIGEIGLDFHWVKEKSYYKYQMEVFEDFLKLAKKYNKIVNVHTKGAEKELYDLLKKYDTRAIIHWYSGPMDILDKLRDLDSIFTISVDAGYSKITDRIIDRLDISRIITETDGAGAMEWVDSSKKSSPLLVENICNYIANKKNLTFEEARYIININLKKFLNE